MPRVVGVNVSRTQRAAAMCCGSATKGEEFGHSLHRAEIRPASTTRTVVKINLGLDG